jgi:hypothetical protein
MYGFTSIATIDDSTFIVMRHDEVCESSVSARLLDYYYRSFHHGESFWSFSFVRHSIGCYQHNFTHLFIASLQTFETTCCSSFSKRTKSYVDLFCLGSCILLFLIDLHWFNVFARTFAGWKIQVISLLEHLHLFLTISLPVDLFILSSYFTALFILLQVVLVLSPTLVTKSRNGAYDGLVLMWPKWDHPLMLVWQVLSRKDWSTYCTWCIYTYSTDSYLLNSLVLLIVLFW